MKSTKLGYLGLSAAMFAMACTDRMVVGTSPDGGAGSEQEASTTTTGAGGNPAGSGGSTTNPAGSGGSTTNPAGSGGSTTNPAGSGGASGAGGAVVAAGGMIDGGTDGSADAAWAVCPAYSSWRTAAAWVEEQGGDAGITHGETTTHNIQGTIGEIQRSESDGGATALHYVRPGTPIVTLVVIDEAMRHWTVQYAAPDAALALHTGDRVSVAFDYVINWDERMHFSIRNDNRTLVYVAVGSGVIDFTGSPIALGRGNPTCEGSSPEGSWRGYQLLCGAAQTPVGFDATADVEGYRVDNDALFETTWPNPQVEDWSMTQARVAMVYVGP